MKALFFSLVSMLSTVLAVAQDYPGDMPELLLNKQLRVKPLSEESKSYGYRDFYTTPDMLTTKGYKHLNSSSTPHNELEGKIFTVANVESVGSQQYPSFRLTLKSEEMPVLYFKYNPKYDMNYHFEVIGGLKLPEDFYCKQFESTKQVSGNNVMSPVNEGITMMKSIVDGRVIYNMHIKVIGDKAEVGKKGAVIQLKNGKTIKKAEAKIQVEVGSTGNYLYTTVFNLTTTEMTMLSQDEITHVSLFTFGKNIERGNLFKEYAKCLLK